MSHLFNLPKELISIILDQFIHDEYKILLISLTSKEFYKLYTNDKIAPEELFIESIASEGSISLLQWSKSIGISWTRETCSTVAQGGHLKVLQWLKPMVVLGIIELVL